MARAPTPPLLLFVLASLLCGARAASPDRSTQLFAFRQPPPSLFGAPPPSLASKRGARRADERVVMVAHERRRGKRSQPATPLKPSPTQTPEQEQQPSHSSLTDSEIVNMVNSISTGAVV